MTLTSSLRLCGRASWLLVASALAAGCTSSAAGDGGGGDGATTFTVTWAVKDVSGAAAACLPGFTTVKIVADAAADDLMSYPNNGLFSTYADCSAGSQQVTLYRSGNVTHDMDDGYGPDVQTEVFGVYKLVVELTDPTGEVVQTTSFTSVVDVTKGAQPIDVTLYPQGGFMTVEWDLVSNVSGQYVTSCAAVDVDTIEHRYHAFGDDTAPLTIDRFPCGNTVAGVTPSTDAVGIGLSRPLAPDSYVGTLYALSHGVEVGSAETTVFVMDGNRVTDHEVPLDIAGH